MEHGLGATVLGKLIGRIHERNPLKDYDNVKDALKPRLRTGDETTGNIDCHLEYPVQHNSGNSYIDVVFKIGKLVLCIENKINAGSTSLEQFKNEYLGIIDKKEIEKDQVGMVFLVPAPDRKSQLHQNFIDEYDALKDTSLKNEDFKIIVTWQSHDDYISVVDILCETLSDEANAIIDPIPEYARHTIKALISFIKSEFSGYYYENKLTFSGMNPETEKKVIGSMLLPYHSKSRFA